MATFPDLPVEIILQILSYLSASDFMKLSAVCSFFHECVWKYGDIENRVKYRWIWLKSNQDLEKALGLLLSILRNPSLGQYVRGVEMHYPPRQSVRDESLSLGSSLDAEDYSRLLDCACAACFSDQERAQIMEALTTSNYHQKRAQFVAHSLAALILSVSPCVESIAIAPILDDEQPSPVEPCCKRPLELLLRRAHYEQHENALLPMSIKHLRGVHCMFTEDMAMQQMRCLMRVESLGFPDSINANICQARTEMSNFTWGPHASLWGESDSPVVYILKWGHNTNSRIVLNCSASYFQDFRFALGDRTRLGGGLPRCNPKTLFQTLLGYRDELETLNIIIEDGGLESDKYGVGIGRESAWYTGSPQLQEKPDLDGTWEISPAVDLLERTGSLKDFTKLRHVTIGIQLLWLFAIGLEDSERTDLENFSLLDSLPPNIERLLVEGYVKSESERVDRLVQEIHTKRHERLPSLKNVKGLDDGWRTIPHPYGRMGKS